MLGVLAFLLQPQRGILHVRSERQSLDPKNLPRRARLWKRMGRGGRGRGRDWSGMDATNPSLTFSAFSPLPPSLLLLCQVVALLSTLTQGWALQPHRACACVSVCVCAPDYYHLFHTPPVPPRPSAAGLRERARETEGRGRDGATSPPELLKQTAAPRGEGAGEKVGGGNQTERQN